GTVTEVYDYLRVLYARLGQPYCPDCDIPIGTQTADEIIDKIMNLPEATRLYVTAPLERRGQEKYDTLWEDIRKSGFVRMRVDGRSYNVEQPPAIDHRRKHLVEVVVDRLVVRNATDLRFAPGEPGDSPHEPGAKHKPTGSFAENASRSARSRIADAVE